MRCPMSKCNKIQDLGSAALAGTGGTSRYCRKQNLYFITFGHWASHQHSILLRWFLLGQSFWRANKKPMLKISEVPSQYTDAPFYYNAKRRPHRLDIDNRYLNGVQTAKSTQYAPHTHCWLASGK